MPRALRTSEAEHKRLHLARTSGMVPVSITERVVTVHVQQTAIRTIVHVTAHFDLQTVLSVLPSRD